MTSPSDRPRLRPQQALFTVLVALVLIAAGSVGTWLWANPATPETLTQSTPLEASPLEAQDYVDTRTVTLTVDKATARGLTAHTTGVLTDYQCTPGGTWSSGTSPAAVNSVPLLAFHTGTPLWRDLTYGDEGDDVTAVQTELARLGYDVSVDGWFGWATWNAYRLALENIGATAEPRTLTLASLIWLPDADTAITGCPLQVGDPIADDTDLAERAGGLSEVAVANLPADLAPGARVLTFAGVAAPLDEHGAVTDENALQELAQTDAIRAYDPEPSNDLTATIRLTEPITVYSVPVSAIGDPSAEPWVTADGTRYPVTIIASSLGRSLITFADGTDAPAQIDTAPDEDAS